VAYEILKGWQSILSWAECRVYVHGQVPVFTIEIGLFSCTLMYSIVERAGVAEFAYFRVGLYLLSLTVHLICA
jgi:hypothetical protein